MKSTRVKHEHKSHLSLWLGLFAAVAVVAAVCFFGHAQEQKKKAGTFNYLKPVPGDGVLRAELTEEQYRVTRQNGTETAFHNDYWDNQRPGIYVDIITGEALFSSLDKFDGGTGRPNFTKPISKERVVEKKDLSYAMERAEVRASRSDSHLGHLSTTGPHRTDNVIPSTPPRSTSFLSKNCRQRATANICRSSRNRKAATGNRKVTSARISVR